jgi:hypothetical protein
LVTKLLLERTELQESPRIFLIRKGSLPAGHGRLWRASKINKQAFLALLADIRAARFAVRIERDGFYVVKPIGSVALAEATL